MAFNETETFLDLNATPFLSILHTVLRIPSDGSDAENSRVQKANEWLFTNGARLRVVLNDAERALIIVVRAYIEEHGVGLDRNMLDIRIRQEAKHVGMLEILKQYDKELAEMPKYCYADMGGFLDERILDYEKEKLIALIGETGQINTGMRFTPVGQPPLKGPRDAVSFFRQELQKGKVFVDGDVIQGGKVSEQIKAMKATYQKNKLAHEDGTLYVPTGLLSIDNRLRGGLGRGEFVGILGYTGQRKSGLARQIAYNAAYRGFNVLFIPIEVGVDEELEFHGALHAHNDRNFTSNQVSKEAIHTGTLSPVDFKFYEEEVLFDFEHGVAKHLRICKLPGKPTWDDVQSFIELEHRKEPLDLVVCDYLSLLAPVGRDQIAEMTAIIHRAKQFILKNTFCFLTPVQGNRKGFEDATAHEGKWEPSGIYLFSEIEKSLDILFYVYASDAMKEVLRWQVGTCKSRRTADIPATFFEIDDMSGGFFSEKVTDAPAKGGKTAAKLETDPDAVFNLNMVDPMRFGSGQ